MRPDIMARDAPAIYTRRMPGIAARDDLVSANLEDYLSAYRGCSTSFDATRSH